jgi:cystathionine gamma-lyase/homocysteine desulfhydrase
MHRITKSLHTRVDISNADAVVTPIFQASAFQSTSPFFYTRKNNPNIKEFEEVIATLEEATYCIATTTGMSAIALVVGLLKPGETLVVNKDIYGCSYKLFQKYSDRIGIDLVLLDLSIEENFLKIPVKTSMVLFETPTNPFLKTVQIERISKQVKSNNPNTIIVVDNTWATPLYQQPIKHGADISLYSATKYFSGHSDVMGGCILTDGKLLYESLLELRFYFGCVLEPQSAWLLRRSMQTFSLRMAAHQSITIELKLFLQNLPQVKKIYYPEIDGKQLKGYGTLIFFDLREDLVDNYTTFAQSLDFFDTGTGMACVTSMIAQPYTGSHASMSDVEKCEIGLDKGLIRLSFGLENVEDLKNDLKNAFDLLEKI